MKMIVILFFIGFSGMVLANNNEGGYCNTHPHDPTCSNPCGSSGVDCNPNPINEQRQ